MDIRNDPAEIPRSSALQLIRFLMERNLLGKTLNASLFSSSPSTTARATGVSSSIQSCVVHNISPLRLIFDEKVIADASRTLLVCLCDPRLPGMFWSVAGSAGDSDEVDLMCSSDLVNHLLNQTDALRQDQALLASGVQLFRPSEGSRLVSERSKVKTCDVLFVPFDPNCSPTALRDKFRMMIERAPETKYDSILIPMGRWARNEANALDIALRLSKVLEQFPESPSRRIHICCAPEHSHWQHSVKSVLASTKARFVEEQVAQAASVPLTAVGGPSRRAPDVRLPDTQPRVSDVPRVPRASTRTPSDRQGALSTPARSRHRSPTRSQSRSPTRSQTRFQIRDLPASRLRSGSRESARFRRNERLSALADPPASLTDRASQWWNRITGSTKPKKKKSLKK